MKSPTTNQAVEYRFNNRNFAACGQCKHRMLQKSWKWPRSFARSTLKPRQRCMSHCCSKQRPATLQRRRCSAPVCMVARLCDALLCSCVRLQGQINVNAAQGPKQEEREGHRGGTRGTGTGAGHATDTTAQRRSKSYCIKGYIAAAGLKAWRRQMTASLSEQSALS